MLSEKVNKLSEANIKKVPSFIEKRFPILFIILCDIKQNTSVTNTPIVVIRLISDEVNPLIVVKNNVLIAIKKIKSDERPKKIG